MTLSDLKTIFERSYKVIERERSMRIRVLKGRPDYQAKVTEMEQLQADLMALKDELKRRMEAEGTPAPTQQPLLIVDSPVKYGGYS